MEVSLENVGEQYGANLGNSTSSVVSLGLHHIATPGSKNEVHLSIFSLTMDIWQVIGKNRNTSQFPTVDYSKKTVPSRIKKTNNLT